MIHTIPVSRPGLRSIFHTPFKTGYWLQRERAQTEDIGTIEKEAFLLYLNYSIKYLFLGDTLTACRKYVYNFDI